MQMYKNAKFWVTFILTLAINGLGITNLYSQNQQKLNNFIETQLESYHHFVSTNAKSIDLALDRFVERAKIQNHIDSIDAKNYINDFAPLNSIYFFDENKEQVSKFSENLMKSLLPQSCHNFLIETQNFPNVCHFNQNIQHESWLIKKINPKLFVLFNWTLTHYSIT